MYVVAVTFEAKPEHIDDLGAALRRQAENSVALEEGCHRFDVSIDRASPATYFLYEVYTDEAAFQDHLASNHYAEFSAMIGDWLANRSSRRLDSVVHIPAIAAG